MDGSDDSPGLLWWLDIKDRDGNSVRGWPKIITSDREYVQRLGYWMNKSYEKNLGYTFIKRGCTRGPWVNLDGPTVAENPLNLPEDPEWPVAQILDEILRR